MRHIGKISGAVSMLALLALVSACSQPAASPAASEAATSAASEAVSAASEATSAASEATSAASAASEAASGAASAASGAAPATGKVTLDIKDAAGVQLTGDPVAGAKVFRQCATCHVITKGVNKVGPSLHAIVGRTAGQVEGFRYSEANKKSGVVWTEQKMYEYLENPKKVIPGTIMAFVGLKKSEDRANVIAYLQENTK